ncbi:MAG: BREX-1 system adenine-specific DNA-methyltransferase PglX [Lysobacteraceae bacterium]|nr:MAG: BREX-1 system adenine-specific DNA-methyltransferase PglX [Xanthomonadaceae bacterium]
MNTGNLKSYAPQARRDFIAAVTARANLLGLSESKGALQVADAEVKNDVLMIAGRPWPVKVNEQRNKLIARMKQQGFGQTIEAVAYAWFNRLAALRFMEVHDYLGHGRRVLSNPAGGLPEVLAHALDLAESNALPGLSANTVRELKLANQDPELYRLILIAQCNALHQAMPFLFEQLGDETELLLPENLLLTDSVVAKLVQSIPEEDWQQIEIIGWLYQFYISEKKDQVIGKVVKSEDIPAATQLFTPNWIVKYMVQNSLGAQWLATYPDSPLKAQMDYYIEPAEQTDEVNAQLAAITPTSLNPEELTLIDPACGSGHILVEAYELFKAIYLERGYRQRDVAQLILEKNLFGLDIDERAAQLAGFALMMKGRADDRRLFERTVKLNVLALMDSAGFDAERLAQGVKLADYGLKLGDLTALKELFEHATTFGSLIRVPEGVASKLPALKKLSGATRQDLFVAGALKSLVPLVQQAELLATQYDAVVANPPYLSDKHFTRQLKSRIKGDFHESRHNLYSVFLDRAVGMLEPNGHVGMVTLHSWMSGSKYQPFRERLIGDYPIGSMAHLGSGAFESIGGQVVSATTFVVCNQSLANYRGVYLNLTTTSGERAKASLVRDAANDADSPFRYVVSGAVFSKVPGSPIVYWISSRELHAFLSLESLDAIADFRQGMATTDNERFLRRWSELSIGEVAMDVSSTTDRSAREKYWFPYNKGGGDRRWYGHNDYVVRYEDDGDVLIELVREKYPRISDPEFVIKNRSYYFRPSVTYSALSDGEFAARICGRGFIFDTKGSCAFPTGDVPRENIASLLNSCVASTFLRLLAPTLDFSLFALKSIPVPAALPKDIETLANRCLPFAAADWDAYERSWDFQSFPILTASSDPGPTLESTYTAWITQNRATIAEMKRLEEENNRLFIEAYGLQDELIPDVPIEQITLTVNPAYRYGGKLSEEEQWTRFRQDTMAELVSYAIGCMMGRYSLDAPGLIYAHRGNIGFDASRYTKFPADADGIVPVTDELWFEDDAALRVREFLLAVWGAASLGQNMAFLADDLGRKASESPEEAIRRYLADKFFKDHLQTYKKRPIYWLFSSGKQGAFQALVYLHRYNAGTLSRLRAEYVVPLTGKMQSKIELLEKDVAASSSTAQRNKLSKQRDKLRKQHLGLLAYDEQLRHFADQRIELDLDDGVKVNYGKFGDLLAEVKAVTGGKGDDE